MLIVFSIVATGNHFWIDAVLGGYLAASPGLAWLIESWHPTLPDSARVRLHLGRRAPPPRSPQIASVV